MKRALLFIGVWTVLGLFFASRSILIYSYSQDEVDWGLPLKLSLAEWYGWALLAPAVWWLARRFNFRGAGASWKTSLGLHLVASFVVAAAKVQIDGFVQPLVGGFASTLPYKLHTNLVTYWAIVGVSEAVRYYRALGERELEASRLETQLANAQLDLLKSELHPHFLFNTLHGISALMHRDVEAADRMLASLSDLLRHSLDHMGVQRTSLKSELEFLSLYLDIETMRLGDRLRVSLDVAPETLDATVPSLLLQPLVENAVRHAVAARTTGGRITIRAARRDGRLALYVEDDGPGFASADPFRSSKGIGLANTRARLERLYGKDHALALESGSAGGAVARLELPFQPFEPDSAPGAAE